MTAGESFDLDTIDRFGDPWHGLLRSGVIELPNSTTRAPVGTLPNDGSSHTIKIPGAAAVTTSAADATAGMTWLNYALMTGNDHCVYGLPLGNVSWIYIDADDLPWRAELSGSGSSLTITLTRFGILDRTGTAAAIHTKTISFTWPTDAGILYNVDDVDSAGRTAAIVFYVLLADGAREVRQVWTAALSGVAASLSITMVDRTPSPLEDSSSGVAPGCTDTDLASWWVRPFDASGVVGPFEKDQYGYFVGYTPPSGGYDVCYGPPAHEHYFTQIIRVVGATLHGDVFRLVTLTMYLEVLAAATVDTGRLFESGTELNNGFGNITFYAPFHRTTTVSGYYRITVDGRDADANVVSVFEDWLFDGPGPTVNYGDGVWTGPRNVITPVTISGVTEPTPYYGYASPFTFGAKYVRGLRMANRAYMICAMPGTVIPFRIAGPVSDTAATDETFATAHPITGQLIIKNSGVCWV